MSVVIESRIVGTFLGYAPGVVHRMDDGSEWEQVGNVEEYVYREPYVPDYLGPGAALDRRGRDQWGRRGAKVFGETVGRTGCLLTATIWSHSVIPGSCL